MYPTRYTNYLSDKSMTSIDTKDTPDSHIVIAAISYFHAQVASNKHDILD